MTLKKKKAYGLLEREVKKSDLAIGWKKKKSAKDVWKKGTRG